MHEGNLSASRRTAALHGLITPVIILRMKSTGILLSNNAHPGGTALARSMFLVTLAQNDHPSILLFDFVLSVRKLVCSYLRRRDYLCVDYLALRHADLPNIFIRIANELEVGSLSGTVDVSHLAVRRIVGEGSEVEHLDETATSLITVVNRDYRKGSRSEITCDDGVSRQLSSKLPFGYGMAMYHRQIT